MLTKVQIKKKVLSYCWEPWLERPFGAFMLSFFEVGAMARSMRRIGVYTAFPLFFFEHGHLMWSDDAARPFIEKLKQYCARGKSVGDVIKHCEKYRAFVRRALLQMAHQKISPRVKAKRALELIGRVITYGWFVHGMQKVLEQKLRQALDTTGISYDEKFIGDITFSEKRSGYQRMEDAIRKNESSEKIAKKYGWVRVRNAFIDPFTPDDIEKMKMDMRQTNRSAPFVRPFIPRAARTWAKELRDLSYLCILRTDFFYEMLWIARPIFQSLANHFGLEFYALRDYALTDLSAGEAIQQSKDVSAACYYGRLVFFDTPLFKLKKASSVKIVRGVVAYKGKASGTVKIVKTVDDLQKVQKADILIAQMIFPAFAPATRLSSAVVTDEGNSTCHAAIIARGMRKPCIINTKIASQVFKDGDRVEVDAIKGIIKKLSA